MRKISFIVFFAFFASQISGQIDAPDPDFCEKIACMDEQKQVPFLKGNSKSFIGNNYDLKYHRCYWEINPAVLFIKGNITSYFKVTQSSITDISFVLDSALTVDSVKYHGTKMSFTHSLDAVNIQLGTSLSLGTLDSLTIFYQGIPKSGSGFGSFVKETHNGIPIIWTLSEPFGSGEWWPCKDDLSDKIDSIDIIVKTPLAYRVASNGLLVNEYQLGLDKFYHWKHRYPITAYLVAIAVTNYSVYSDYVPMGNDSLQILNYVYPESLATLKPQSKAIIPVMQLFNKLFTDYPFKKEKYGHAQFNWGGGMEHQTMSFMNNFGYELMAHELAHMWFGDMVTCGSWHDIWLNEGFATYASGLCYEHLDSIYGYWKTWKNNKMNHVTSQPAGSVYVVDTTSVYRIFNSRLSYSKGAMVLHGLRWVIGDSAFFAAITNYLHDPKHSYGYAKTPDLQVHFEIASGKNLTGFFNDWIYGEGYPTYNTIVQYVPGGSWEITLNQTTSHVSVNFFKMPVPLRFYFGSKDTTIVFEHDFSGQKYNVILPQKPDSVVFDPEKWIISKNNSLFLQLTPHEISNQIKFYPNPVNDVLSLESENLKIFMVEVLNPEGQQIYQVKINNQNEFKINTSNLSKGIYFVKIYTEKGTFVKRILKVD